MTKTDEEAAFADQVETASTRTILFIGFLIP